MLSFKHFFENKKEKYNKISFYYEYFKNLCPKTLKIIKENDKIIIKINK